MLVLCGPFFLFCESPSLPCAAVWFSLASLRQDKILAQMLQCRRNEARVMVVYDSDERIAIQVTTGQMFLSFG